MKKQVWVSLNMLGNVIRIFNSEKAACASPGMRLKVNYGVAVYEIRHQLFLRSDGYCELCLAPITEQSAHMHERQHRGKGGEISLENSVMVCAACHRYEHKDRNPRWKNNSENT